MFLPSVDFFKSSFLKTYFRNTIRVSNSLNPDQVGHLIWPVLGLNCLQRLSACATGKLRVKVGVVFGI